MKKILLITAIALSLGGCGKSLEPKTKPITIQSETNSKAYTDQGEYLGQGKSFNAMMDNRKGKKGDVIILKEVGNEENQVRINMEREFNSSAHWNWLVFPIISWPTDLISGGTQRLAKTHYLVPEFGEHAENNNSYRSAQPNKYDQRLDNMEMKEEIKRDLEAERTKERVLLLEAQN